MAETALHLLVDGSNLIRAFSETCALIRRDSGAAKALLVRKVAVLHDFLGWRVTVVFDGRGDALAVEPVGSGANFACVHTPKGVTADDIIEQLVGRSAEPGNCLVATDDQAERMTVQASGADWCGSDELERRIDAANTRKGRAIGLTNLAEERMWKSAELELDSEES